MPAFTSSPFEPSDLDDLTDLVDKIARSRWPKPSYLLTSNVAWELPDSEGNVRLWRDDSGPAAYAWFNVITPSYFDFRPDIGSDHPIALDVLDWIEARRREFKPMVPWLLNLDSMEAWEQALADGVPEADGTETIVQVSAFDGAPDRIALLRACGFEPSNHFEYYLSRSLETPIETPALPDGWSIRHVEASEFDARVAVHRNSWFRSSYTLADYLAVRSIPIFEPTLDLVAVTPSGEFASYCIGWIDEATGVGSFEPVGTPPAFRRRGLGHAVQFEGLRRMKALGMHSAKIGTAGFNDRAYGLYSSCGFRLMDKGRTWIKAL